jgi:nitroreductase
MVGCAKNETLTSIFTRRSVRFYRKKKVGRELLLQIIKAAQAAPSGRNRRECQFTVVETSANRKKMRQKIEKAKGIRHYWGLYGAPVVIIVSTPKDYTYKYQDGSCALENMMIAANSLNLGSTWVNQLVTLSDSPDICSLLDDFKIPQDHQIVGSLALGYPVIFTRREKNRKREIVRFV